MAKELIPAMEEVFGKLDHTEIEFTNTGVRHRRFSDGAITLDQDDYIRDIKPIIDKEMIGATSDAEASPKLHALFMSLLGAAAYFLITQWHLCVYSASLQRRLESN